jgi:hypothetical protein
MFGEPIGDNCNTIIELCERRAEQSVCSFFVDKNVAAWYFTGVSGESRIKEFFSALCSIPFITNTDGSFMSNIRGQPTP